MGDELPYDLFPHFSADRIYRQHSSDGDHLRAMLRQQLQLCTNTVWRNIVDALRSPDVRESQLADQLEAKYCPSEFTNNNILLYFSEYNAVQHYT